MLRVPSEILAGTPAGGGQDRAARALAAAIAELGGGEPVVTNMPGRGGGYAWDELADRVGDSSVVAISSPTLMTNGLLGVSAIDDRDLTPIANLYTEFIAFAVADGSSIGDGGELAERLAADSPPVVAFATAVGNVNHIALAQVTRHAGGAPGRLAVRVFDSARHAVADVLAGHAEVVAVSAPSVVPEVLEGSLRVVAVSSPAPLAAPLQDVPTWDELGVPCGIGTWRGVVAPAALDVIEVGGLDAMVQAAVATDRWREALASHGWSDTFIDAGGINAFLSSERVAMSKALRDLALL